MSLPPSCAALELRPLPSTGVTRLPPVLRASPPPCSARPDPRGLSVGACHATGRASRVASIPLVHTCRRHYPGGTGRCSRRSLPDRWQPSPYSRAGRLPHHSFRGLRSVHIVAARVVAEPPRAALVVGVLQPMSLPPSSAPTATGWSDSCRRDSHPLRNGAFHGRTRAPRYRTLGVDPAATIPPHDDRRTSWKGCALGTP